MSNEAALAARAAALQDRVDALQHEVEKANGHAEACRSAATQLQGPRGSVSDVSIDVGGMRSRSAKVDRARAKAERVAALIDRMATELADAVDDLGRIARKYEQRADTARSRLRPAHAELESVRARLAHALANGVG